jgi:hypothetical protein
MQDILKNDYLLHGKNIEQLLLLRGLIKEEQRGQVEQLIKQGAGSISIDFDLKFTEDHLKTAKHVV